MTEIMKPEAPIQVKQDGDDQLKASGHVTVDKMLEVKEALKNQFWLTRIVFLRYLCFMYLVAFFIAFLQNTSLIGERGLTPAKTFIARYREQFSSNHEAFLAHPTIFWYIEPSDRNLELLALLGGGISFLMLLLGHGSMLMLLMLWLGYMSLVNVGQTWYSFGWESQILENGFLAIFAVPVIGGWWSWLWFGSGDMDSRFPSWTRCPWGVVWGNRWLLFRIMLGSGLIKIRGDECWRDLTCMNYHYETQPVPNPISIFFHSSPESFHKMETIANHVVELLGPWLLLVPERRCQMIGGIVQILFQIVLIVTGNYAFLNWLTILPAILCLDDAFWSFLFTKKDCMKAIEAEQKYRAHFIESTIEETNDQSKEDKSRTTTVLWLKREYFTYPARYPSFVIFTRRIFGLALALFLGYLSYPVVLNMSSSKQMMNRSYDPFRIVNTYGLFGGVTKVRNEVIFQATTDEAIHPKTVWKELQFRCKPGDINRTPCVITPYHLRIDWLMWFAAFQNYQQCPWIVHIAYKILHGDDVVNDLLDPKHGNPFYDLHHANGTRLTDRERAAGAPRYVRAMLYEYRYRKVWGEEARKEEGKFTDQSRRKDDETIGKGRIVDDEWEIGRHWKRKLVGEYLPAIEKENLSVKQFLQAHGMI